uniref:MADF domain-containing protein n=1 Tax=Anopheles maculatus TaxID=74869 RepID=A0A182SV73_9DIPT
MDESDKPNYSEVKLIELIKRQPAVWNKHDSLYSNKIAEKTVWEEISNLLETDVEVIKKRWRNLRSQFQRECRMPRASKWKHFERLSFLTGNMSPMNGSLDCREEDEEDDPIRIERPPKRASMVLKEPKEEPPFEWAYASPTMLHQRAEKSTPPVQAPPSSVQAPPPGVSDDGNYYFALSLVGILNSIPKSQELAARLAVLNVLKDFQQPQAERSLQAQPDD